jgi:hypothetical protein
MNQRSDGSLANALEVDEVGEATGSAGGGEEVGGGGLGEEAKV